LAGISAVRRLGQAGGTTAAGASRGGLIRKALLEWLDKKTRGSPGWPSLILEWSGDPQTPPFESYRGEWPPPREDPFS